MEEDTKVLVDMLPFLIPVIIIELGLIVFALVDLFKREHYKTENRVAWAIVIIILGIIGPVLYFLFGRKEGPLDGD
jgi:4-amino-4-deoxy-L-arabinose transferase-like glycosyltransferase